MNNNPPYYLTINTLWPHAFMAIKCSKQMQISTFFVYKEVFNVYFEEYCQSNIIQLLLLLVRKVNLTFYD